MAKKKTAVVYKNLGALKPVENLLEEAGQAVHDGSRVASHVDDMNAALGAAGGGAIGFGIGYAALYYAGIQGLGAAGITSGLAFLGVGGGMVAGIGAVAAPVAILAVGGYAVIARRNRNKLEERKQMMLQDVLKKHAAVLAQLKKETDASAERIDYLTRLNTLLQAAIRDLHSDLAPA